MAVRKLIFATGNSHKIREVAEMLDGRFVLRGLHETGITEDIPETKETIEGNALQKAFYVYDRLQENCFAEDTGLEVDGLNGAPGVLTARYAGPARDADANMQKVLSGLAGSPDRRARFRTVIALILGGRQHTFEGVVEGVIAEKPSGKGGFGYDPIFRPEGSPLTFAEMPASEKHRISHRGRALERLIRFLGEA